MGLSSRHCFHFLVFIIHNFSGKKCNIAHHVVHKNHFRLSWLTVIAPIAPSVSPELNLKSSIFSPNAINRYRIGRRVALTACSKDVYGKAFWKLHGTLYMADLVTRAVYISIDDDKINTFFLIRILATI